MSLSVRFINLAKTRCKVACFLWPGVVVSVSLRKLETSQMGEQNELETLNECSGRNASDHKGNNRQSDPTISSSASWTKLLTFAGFASTLGSAVPAGYCIGVMNSPGVFMRQWCNDSLTSRFGIHLSTTQIDLLWSAIVSIFLVGGAVGSLAGAVVSNKYGRKKAVFTCGFLFVLGGVCFYFCRILNSVEILLLGRLLVGLGSGLTMSSLPMYLSEIAPLVLRGTLGVFCAVGFSAGVVVAQLFSLRSVFGTEYQWHIALSFYLILVAMCFGPFFLYPESPKWLYVIQGDHEEAQLQLMRLRGKLNADDLTKEMEGLDAEASVVGESSSFCNVLKDRKFLMPLMIVCIYQGGQQLSGINAIFYYSVSIFRRAGLSPETAEWANLGAGSLNLATSLLGPLLMASINRRPLMLLSTSACCIFLLLFALMLYFIESVAWFGYGCIACIYLYIFFFQFGIGPIPFFIGSELFEVSPRPVAMSLGSLSSWCCNFIIGMAFPTLQNAWGAFVFLPFSLTCFVMFVLTRLYLPETRGSSPSEVAALVAKGFRSRIP